MIRRAILKAIAIPGYQVAVRQPAKCRALWLGHRRRAGDGRPSSDLPTVLKVIDQGSDDTTKRDLDPQVLRQDRRCRDDDLYGGRKP